MHIFNENNFKEIRITPNKDSNLKAEIFGLKFSRDNGESLIGTVVYPRLKVTPDFDMRFKTHRITIETLPGENEDEGVYFNLYVPEEIE